MIPMDPNALPKPVDWLAEGLAMRGRINGIFGAEKAGKSRLLGSMLAHAYCGAPWLGLATRTPGKTLYLLGEETEADVATRLRRACDLARLDFSTVAWGSTITFCPAAGMRLDQEQSRLWLESQLVGGGYSTVIVDPLRRVHGGRETSNDDMALISNALRDWTNRLGLTVILVHHTGKIGPDDDETRIATWSRGATDLPAILDWAIYVKRFRGRGTQPDQVVIQSAGRGARRDALKLLDHGDTSPGWTLGGHHD